MFGRLITRMAGKPYKRKYRIGDMLFAGAFSTIYEAEHRSDGCRAVLKILTESGERIARLLDRDPRTMWEGEILMTLRHPNIVRGYDCGAGRKYWVAMEHLDAPLNTYIARSGRDIAESDRVDILLGVAKAISYLHGKGLVHRDIATDNVMLKGSEARLIDFGMTVPIGSKVVRGRVGTPSYMAPEMIRKEEYTPGGDVYSFGMVMYEVVTGMKPFYGELKEGRMTKALNMTPVSPSVLGKPCSKALEDLIMDCVSKNPRQRPEDANEVVEKLENLRAGGGEEL